MTDRPIIFSAPMVRALLDGTKTQTRRVLKFSGRAPEFCGGVGDKDDPTCWGWEDSEHGDWVTLERDTDQRMGWRDWRGAYQIGDSLWVRENFQLLSFGDYVPAKAWPADVRFAATDSCADLPVDVRGYPWRPSIHMPRWASRLTLIVTDVRIERLQDISEEDAIAEGSREPALVPIIGACWSERDAYAKLWNHINGPEAWELNPWVVAVSFTVHQCNIDQLHQQTEAA